MDKKNYVLGILGSLVGAMVATIPWILVYVYGNMMLSLLAILIAFGAFYGYKLCHGPVNKKLPIVIVVISVIAVSIATLVIIPLCLLAREGYIVSLDNLKVLYDSQEFVSALMQDYVVSVLFTFLGISGVVSNLKRQFDEGVSSEEIHVTNTKELKEQQKAIEEEVVKIFQKNKALSKDSAQSKSEILEEFSKAFGTQAKTIFNQYVLQQKIRKSKGKYYYDEKVAGNKVTQFLLLYGKVLLWVALIIVCIAIIVALGN